MIARLKKTLLAILIISFPVMVYGQTANNNPRELIIKKCNDFKVTGDGGNGSWDLTDWIVLPLRAGEGGSLTTRVKVLYSGTGIYFLFDCKDSKLTNTMMADLLDLWKEDVVEIFLWTDESSPSYFEYEISPLDYELPLLISNEGDLTRWIPFHYDPDRKTSHATIIRGGEKKSNSIVDGWSAEFFIPFKLLRPLKNYVPVSGTRWRANMYRIDYDNIKRNSWSWQLTTKSFHDFEKFGTFIFE